MPALQAGASRQVMTYLSDDRVIVIVPTAAQRPHLLRAWLQKYPQRQAPAVMTMAHFVRRLGMQIMSGGPRILHESAVNVLLRQAAANHPSVTALGMRAERVVRWTQQGLTAERVAMNAEHLLSASRRGRILTDLSQVWSSLNEIYGARGCDRGTYARLLATQIRRQPDVNVLLDDGRSVRRLLMLDTHGITPVDRTLLQELAEHGWDIGILFCNEPPAVADLPVSTTSADVQWFVAHHWQHGGQSEPAIPDTTTCVTAPSRLDEVRTALRLIRTDADQGHDIGRSVICIAGSSDYRRVLLQQAPLMGVPLAIAEERPLSATRIGAAVRAVCMVIIGRWQRIDIERMFADPLLERFRSKGGTDMVTIARRDRIRGGQGAAHWLERLEWGQEATRLALERADDLGADDAWSRNRDVREYGRALAVVKRLSELLEIPASGSMSARSFVHLVETTILEDMGLVDALDEAIAQGNANDSSIDELEGAAPSRLKDVLEFYGALSEDHELGDLPIEEHLMRWWGMVESVTVQQPVPPGVPVLSPAELRGLDADHVIVIGFVEGEFPSMTKNILDEELIPQVLERLDVEAMADCLAASHGRRLTLLWPGRVDDSPTIASSLQAMLPPNAVRLVGEKITVGRPVSRLPQSGAYRPTQSVKIGPQLPEVAAPLAEKEFGRRVSASRLDVMQQCPFRYMASKVMLLDDVSTDDARLTPLERGNILHELIATFFQRVHPLGALEVPTAEALLERRVVLDASRRNTYWMILTSLVDEYSERHNWQHTFAEAERQALIGSVKSPGLLRRWLELEILYQQETGHAPALLEHVLNEDITIDIDGTKHVIPVTTRIDRIDVAQSVSGVSFIVGDYKPRASSGYTTDAVFSGLLSQMPLYIAATSRWLTRHDVPYEPLAAMYRSFGTAIYDTDDPRNQMVLYAPELKAWKSLASVSISQRLKKYEDVLERPLEEQVNLALGNAVGLAGSIRAGYFPVEPVKGACGHCRMKELCRIDQWGQVGKPVQESIA
jgi:RecB family exonuclease